MASKTLRCTECGDFIHVEGANRRDADYRAGRHSGVCRQCELARRSQKAAAKAREMDLPALRGTGKQVAWAETLRIAMLKRVQLFSWSFEFNSPFDGSMDIRGLLKEIRDTVAELGYLPLDIGDGQKFELGAEKVLLVHDRLALVDDARWWIDNRQSNLADVVMHGLKLVARDLAEDAIPEEVREIEREALAEATLRPEEIKSPCVAEIRIVEPAIEVVYDEKRDDFREAIKSLGFRWKDTRWHREIPPYRGPIEERVVQTGSRLLGAGFVVRVFDEELRRRIVAREFTPEPTRWISLLSSGKLAISWSRAEDFYRVASALPGARYQRPFVTVPVSSAESVEDFATRHGFEISPPARQAIEKWRAEFLGLPVVEGTAEQATAVEAEYQPPAPLEVPQNVELDDDLRDDE